MTALMADWQSRIQRIIADSGAQIGVAIRHIESGVELMIGADTPVPLASVVKIPVLVEAFNQLGQGRFTLDERWPLAHDDKALGSGILRYLDDGLALTVRDLITLMTIISDNSATDILMARLGLANIDAHMHRLGLTHTHVVRSLNDIFTDMLPSPDPDQDIYALARWESEHGVRRDGFSYSLGDDNNVSTPREMTRLVEMIFKGDVLDRAACDAMLDILLKQQLNDRIPRFLPAGTRVAHKTGTFSGVRNDSGVIYASERSHIVLTMLAAWDHAACRGDRVAEWRRAIEIDSAMGHIALIAYQTFAEG
ncbi:MAG: serine hydrolase [Anaerolineae bacterium]|nr:serine hydrolase [Anaerolineae bacterium]